MTWAPATPRLFPEILTARAELQPDGVALVVDGVGWVSYATWERRANAFARGLIDLGVQAGQRVGLLFDSEHWIDYAVAFFGTLKAAAVAVPLAGELPAAQVDTMLAHAGAVGLCSPPEMSTAMRGTQAWYPAEVEGGQAGEHLQVVTEADQLAQILYTSGTTGSAKGVACSHANLLFGIVTEGPELQAARRQQVSLHALPVGVNAAQVELTRAAHRSATTVVLPRFEPERFLAVVPEHQVTEMLLVPAMATMLVNVDAFHRHDASSVRHLRLTGAPSPPSLLRRLAEALPRARITNEYALTESFPVAITTTYDCSRPTSVGRPDPDELVRIVGGGGEACVPGEAGEVWLAKPGAPMRSYYGDSVAAAEVFVDGWIRTGDLGYVDDEGFLYLTDRRSDLIITGGRNVSSSEVEAVLHECPAVAEVAVVGMPHEVLGEHVAAVVALRTPMTAADLRAFARSRLPEHAVPDTVVFEDRLPRGISGKVLKTTLRERLAAERPRTLVPARTPTERELAAIWARVLGREAVGVQDRFVDLGGVSISALQVIVEVERCFGVLLRASDLYDAETVEALAATIDTVVDGGVGNPYPCSDPVVDVLRNRGRPGA